jgi:tRNA uridine 5-carboxymethylaminomethyl modification enzyme
MGREYNLIDLLARPRVNYKELTEAAASQPVYSDTMSGPMREQIEQQVEIKIKYQGYIDRQGDEIERLKRQENTHLPADLDYQSMQGLSNELKQKLAEAKPENIGRASRIPGITPAAISLLLIYLKKHSSAVRKVG